MSPISVIMPILASNPFLVALGEFAIKAHRLRADDPSFELIVVEAQAERFKQHASPHMPTGLSLCIDQYFSFIPPLGGIKEDNIGVRAATRDFILMTGTDIVPPPHWDTELLRVFKERPRDAGIATLAAKEPGAYIGPPEPVDMLVEGMFSPFSMWRKGWEYDEAYTRTYQDSDLVMRMYEAGLRAYRNLNAQVLHFGGMSIINDAANRVASGYDKTLVKDEELFYQRWGKSPLAMFGMIRYGHMTYGREHEAWLATINRHT